MVCVVVLCSGLQCVLWFVLCGVVCGVCCGLWCVLWFVLCFMVYSVVCVVVCVVIHVVDTLLLILFTLLLLLQSFKHKNQFFVKLSQNVQTSSLDSCHLNVQFLFLSPDMSENFAWKIRWLKQ